MFFQWPIPSDSSSFAVLPHINGISQPLTRFLKKHDTRVASKAVKTLQQALLSPKSWPSIDLQPNIVWKIPCANCPWTYLLIGETGRCFENRKKEHRRNLKSYVRGSNIAKHVWSSNHSKFLLFYCFVFLVSPILV